MSGNVDDGISAELAAYRLSKTESIQTDPLQLQFSKSRHIRKVAMQAQILLCLLATSVPCERIFSVAGEIVSRRRSDLQPDIVNMLLCLQSWLQRPVELAVYPTQKCSDNGGVYRHHDRHAKYTVYK